jgi:Na+/H+-translocating membrane pyrophosphatase
MEFHLGRDGPNAAGFASGLSSAALLFFSIGFSDEGAPVFLGVIGLALLLVSIMCFTLKIIVRMDNRTGNIEKSISTFFWKKEQSYSIADFTGVGIGTGGESYTKTSTVYGVQLLGKKNLSLPGMSGNKERVMSLADQVGDYLKLPVDKKPKMAFFRWRI